MKKFIDALCVTVLLASFCPSAMADWSETRWGMTIEEVLACEGGTIKPTNDTWTYGVFTGLVPFGVINAYKIGDHHYDVIFSHDGAGNFNSVIFKSGDTAYSDAVKQLTAKLGRPDLVENGFLPSAQWTDRANNNIVRVTLGASTIVQYIPIPSNGF